MSDHWFDQLAAPHTRRHGLKMALAGAIATIPLARAAQAKATTPDCVRPCFYTSQIGNANRTSACLERYNIANKMSIATSIYLSGLLGAGTHFIDLRNVEKCIDNSIVLAKAEQYDCLFAPNCGGFVPNQDILCPGCKEVGGKCCPYPSGGGLTGYLCCRCCADNGDGCKAC